MTQVRLHGRTGFPKYSPFVTAINTKIASAEPNILHILTYTFLYLEGIFIWRFDGNLKQKSPKD